MPKGSRRPANRRRTRRSAPSGAAAPEDNFVDTLKSELAKVHAVAAAEVRTGLKDFGHRGEVNRRLLQDLWEIHNQFEEISVHLTLEPPATLFATFAEYPAKWSFRENFDFGSVGTIELADRAAGWIGYTLRFWYYREAEGRGRLRGIFEWTEGESYHRYSGWMRSMNQAILYDAAEHQVDVKEIHATLKDVVVKWYGAHLNQTPASLVDHLKAKYPAGTAYSKESYR